jgi:hypothetical protein
MRQGEGAARRRCRKRSLVCGEASLYGFDELEIGSQ